jgi:hypothetical protein
MKGSQESLTTVVVKDAANWLTPQEDDSSNVNPKDTRRAGLVSQVNGQANWPTPEATSSCHGHGGTWSTTQFNLHNAAMGIGILPPQWPIRRPDNKTQTTKERMAKRAAKHGPVAPANWPTPDASNHRDGEVLRKDNNLEQGGFHGVSLHHAMTKYGQAAPANPSTDGSRQESWVDWRTPQANEAGARVETLYTKDGQPARPGERAYRKTPDGRMVLQSQTINQQVEMVQNWATPIMGDSHLASTPEVAQKRIEEGKVTLSRQNPGKLNPRWVETLMGLPVGWVMPSCASPVTIEPTNCDSSATESCLQQPSELFAF